jgi:hypothetical protein
MSAALQRAGPRRDRAAMDDLGDFNATRASASRPHQLPTPRREQLSAADGQRIAAARWAETQRGRRWQGAAAAGQRRPASASGGCRAVAPRPCNEPEPLAILGQVGPARGGGGRALVEQQR